VFWSDLKVFLSWLSIDFKFITAPCVPSDLCCAADFCGVNVQKFSNLLMINPHCASKTAQCARRAAFTAFQRSWAGCNPFKERVLTNSRLAPGANRLSIDQQQKTLPYEQGLLVNL